MYTLFPYPTLFRSASAVRRAAPGSNAEHWVTEADEQIRRSRLGTPAGDNARDSLLAAQRSDASYLGLPAAVDRFVDASADAAVHGIRDKNDSLAAARVRDATQVADATQRADSSAIDTLRSEERRVGHEGVRSCMAWWAPS